MIRIEVITGPMFSGKSEELIRRINTAIYAEKNILVLKPQKDTRQGADTIESRRKNNDKNKFEPFVSFNARAIKTEQDVENAIQECNPDVIAIDEVQFFDEWLLQTVNNLIKKYSEKEKYLILILSGLDMNFRGEPFGIMPSLMALADEVVKLRAVCFNCKGKNGPGIMSKRISGTQNEIEIGDCELYEARCRLCYDI